MGYNLKSIADFIGGELLGDGDIEIKGVSSLQEAEKGEIAFVESPRYADMINSTKASCVITSFDIPSSSTPIIKCKNPSLAVTKIIYKMFPHRIEHPKGIHPSATLGKNTLIGKNVSIGAHSVVGDGAKIGDGTVIYPLVFIGDRTIIGTNCLIYPNVTIREKITIQNNVIIHSSSVVGSDGFGYAKEENGFLKIPQIGTVEIQDNVEIGAAVTIDRARFGRTVIGKGTKIDNLVQIAHNVKIGDNCIIVAQAGISGSVSVGNDVIIGGQVGIADHVEIGDKAMLASKCGITKSVPANTVMSGIPARPHNISKRLVAHIDNLPKLVSRIEELEKKMEEIISKTDSPGR